MEEGRERGRREGVRERGGERETERERERKGENISFLSRNIFLCYQRNINNAYTTN